MLEVKESNYGSWRSPITSDLIVSGVVGLGQIAIDGDDIYWVETRPQEKGRYVVVKLSPGARPVDLTPIPFNARTRVHEYGGGGFTASDGLIYFSNFADQRLYCFGDAGDPQAITPEVEMRYADGVIDRERDRIICVREDHSAPGREAVNTIVGIPLSGAGEQITLASGADFYSSPRLNREGSRLAWLQWNHPNMPWDGTELWVADVLEDGSLYNPFRVAGVVDESIFQPEWAPSGDLHFVSDRTGWWNIYRRRDGRIEALCPMEAEFGLPQWVFGMSTYAFESENTIVCAYIERGFSRLGILDTTTGKLEKIETPFTKIEGLRAMPGKAIFIAA